MAKSLVVSGRHSVDDYAAATLYFVCGAVPVSVIPVSILGLLTMHQAALYLVIPVTISAFLIMIFRIEPISWVVHGFRAGLCAVAAYDAVRIPSSWPESGRTSSADSGRPSRTATART